MKYFRAEREKITYCRGARFHRRRSGARHANLSISLLLRRRFASSARSRASFGHASRSRSGRKERGNGGAKSIRQIARDVRRRNFMICLPGCVHELISEVLTMDSYCYSHREIVRMFSIIKIERNHLFLVPRNIWREREKKKRVQMIPRRWASRWSLTEQFVTTTLSASISEKIAEWVAREALRRDDRVYVLKAALLFIVAWHGRGSRGEPIDQLVLSITCDIYVISFSEGSIYRRGARRWRKLYRVNGHIFQAKRFNRVSIIFI